MIPSLAVGVALALLFFSVTAQLLGLCCGLAAVLAVFGAELRHEMERSRSAATAWTPWQATAEVRYPHICGKYVMGAEPNGRIRSSLRWHGKEVQPVTGIALNPFGGKRHSDEYGFNNPPGQWQRDASAILAVGDSFAFGADIQPGEGFVDLIRNRIDPTLNLGCSWNGPLLELASLIEYGPLVRPSTVLWFFYEGNDLTDLEVERRSPLLMRYLEPEFSQGLADRRGVLNELLKGYADARIAGMGPASDGEAMPLARLVYGDLRDRSAVNWGYVRILQNLRWSWGLIELGRERATFTLFREIVQRAAQVATGWGSRFVFVYLPSEHRFTTRLARLEAESYRQRVLAEIGGLRVIVIDVTPVFGRHPSPRSLFHGHYTPAGNALVAETVLKELARPIHRSRQDPPTYL